MSKLQARFFIPLFSRYMPFGTSLGVSGTERSVKTRKQYDHRKFGSDACSYHDNNVNVMLQKKQSKGSRQNNFTETLDDARVDILIRPVHSFTSLSHEAG